MLLAAPAGAILLWKGLRCPEKGRPVRAMIVATLVVACFAGLLGLDSWRVGGNPLRMPYALDRSQYATASVFIWEKPRPAPHYRHKVMEDFYLKWEPAFQDAEHFDTLRGWVGAMVSRAGWILCALGAISVLVFLRIRRGDERATPLLIVVSVFLVGTCLQRYLLLRYLAPVVCVFLAAGVLLAQPLFLRWRQEYQARMRATMALGLILLCAFPMLQLRHDTRSRPVLWQKQAVERHLEEIPGRHAVLVRYSPQHALGSEWVYNRADIDGARLVWGRAMNEEADRCFLEYYRDRHVWLVDADTNPVELTPLDAGGSSGPVEYIRLAGDR
jgi:hypothetical protein